MIPKKPKFMEYFIKAFTAYTICDGSIFTVRLLMFYVYMFYLELAKMTLHKSGVSDLEGIQYISDLVEMPCSLQLPEALYSVLSSISVTLEKALSDPALLSAVPLHAILSLLDCASTIICAESAPGESLDRRVAYGNGYYSNGTFNYCINIYAPEVWQ